jgi:hypothetical protein
VLGDEVGNLADVGAEATEAISDEMVGQFFEVESVVCPKKRAAESVESELATGEDLAAGLEIAEGVQNDLFDLPLLRWPVEQLRLDR